MVYAETVPSAATREKPDRPGRGRPPFVVRRDDLRPEADRCAYCGTAKIVLVPLVPEGEGGGGDQAPPSYELLGGLVRYIRPRANAEPCDVCRLRLAAGTLTPRPDHAVIATPLEQEIARARAWQHEQDNPPPPAAVIAGALFKTGRIVVTPSAGTALAVCHIRDHDTSIAGGCARGEPHALELVRRHAMTAPAGDADRGRELGPLAEEADRNAASVEAGRGVVVSRHVATREGRTLNNQPVQTHRYDLVVATALGPDQLTLVVLAEEFPSD